MTALPKTFDPTAEDARSLRNALGQFGTGVTVITCQSEAGPMGITANSFASVSLDPPLVLWSPAKSSARYSYFAQAQHYAIHILTDNQAEIANAFVRREAQIDAFDWQKSPEDVPLLNGCLARFECRQEALYDGGDHSIVLGRVTRVTLGSGAPLMFHAGRYGAFVETT